LPACAPELLSHFRQTQMVRAAIFSTSAALPQSRPAATHRPPFSQRTSLLSDSGRTCCRDRNAEALIPHAKLRQTAFTLTYGRCPPKAEARGLNPFGCTIFSCNALKLCGTSFWIIPLCVIS